MFSQVASTVWWIIEATNIPDFKKFCCECNNAWQLPYLKDAYLMLNNGIEMSDVFHFRECCKG